MAAVGLAAAVSLGLAGWLLVRPSTVLFGAVLLFVLLFAGLDLLEISRQLSESKPGVAAVAAILLGLHLAAAAVTAKTLVAANVEAAQPG